MRNLTNYYIVILAPLILLILLFFIPGAFGYGIMAYALVYRPVTDFLRLKSKGLMQNKDFVKIFNPFFYGSHLNELYRN